MQERSFICFLSVNAGFEAAVDFDDLNANEWQSIVGCFFHRKVSGGWISLRHASKWRRRGRVPEPSSHALVSLQLNT